VPYYDGVNGSAWLERGGVYAVANIRGGASSARRGTARRRRRTTTGTSRLHRGRRGSDHAQDHSPKKLGIIGGSQGGLLVSGSMVYRPELFGPSSARSARRHERFNKLLAGASGWRSTGTRRPEEWAYIQKWSPYQT